MVIVRMIFMLFEPVLFRSALPHCWAGHNVVISVRFIKTISGWSVLGKAF